MTRDDGIGYCGTCGRRAAWVTLDGFGGCEIHGRGPLNWERPYPKTIVRDADGVRVAVGQRVVMLDGGFLRQVGTVVDVTEPDADWDDSAERAVAIGPYVVVEYDTGVVEQWTAVLLGPDEDHVCVDVSVDEQS